MKSGNVLGDTSETALEIRPTPRVAHRPGASGFQFQEWTTAFSEQAVRRRYPRWSELDWRQTALSNGHRQMSWHWV